MKLPKCTLHARTHRLPRLRFSDEHLTSFAGTVLFQLLFQKLNLKARLARCVRHLAAPSLYGLRTALLILILHLLLGFRRLRDLTCYQDDPLILRVLGLRRMPDVSTLCRSLRALDDRAYEEYRGLSRRLVMTRLAKLSLARLTIDFDGSVLWTTSRQTEGTAVGFNKAKKGARSYYPLFATVAQTAQVLDVDHRPGNVHDSNGAADFIRDTLQLAHAKLPSALLESRLDSAHFNDTTCFWMRDHGVEFTISVPFERFPELKQIIQRRRRWRRINDSWSFFETPWKPKSWKRSLRFVFYRQRVPVPRKGPLQLDLFDPRDYQYEYKVVSTDKTAHAKKVLTFHNGRGSQEGILAELKSQMQMDYLPTRRLLGNKIFTVSAMLAHNLDRELQMATRPRDRGTTQKRAALWIFWKADTLRRRLIQKAGRLTRPQGKLTLTLSRNVAFKHALLDHLRALRAWR